MSGVWVGLGLDSRGEGRRLQPETASLVARLDQVPGAARLEAIDALVAGLKAAGVWQKLDALYVLAAHDAQAARQNWISPSYGLTVGGSPAFTADRGYQGNGTADYLNTAFNPNAASGHFLRDDASLGFWSLTNSAADGLDMGAYVSNPALGRADLRARRSNGQMACYLNDQTYAERLAGPTGAGLFSVSRLDGTMRTVRFNTSYSNSSSAPTVSLVNAPLHILGASNWPSGRSARLCSAAWIGGGLTQGEHDAMYEALAQYMATLSP